MAFYFLFCYISFVCSFLLYLYNGGTKHDIILSKFI